MHIKYKQDNFHRITWYIGMCGIMVMGLHYGQMCVLHGPGIQWLFVASATLIGGHYRTNIISSVGHPRSDLIMLLVLCMVTCNGWDTGIVLQIYRDSSNPTEKK
jgi:hypothetical protein